MSVGANIKQRRFELRMTQQELAEAMGYKTRSTIAKIESEENDVSHRKLQKFAAVLETTPEALMGAAPVGQTAVSVFEGERTNRAAVIVLAGGKTMGNRQNIPSQFISIHGKPVLVYSLEVYQQHPAVDDILVVCLRGWEEIVKAYARQYGITKLRLLVTGGSSGVASLKNGVEQLKDYGADDVVIVQEATRPMVTAETVSSLLRACAESGSATICHSMSQYVQFDISGGKPTYVNRDAMIALQSPEAHRMGLLRAVFAEAQQLNRPLTESCFTMLLHGLGHAINFVESSVNNIKLAREEDLAAFDALVGKSG